jgi:hypothetical protein
LVRIGPFGTPAHVPTRNCAEPAARSTSTVAVDGGGVKGRAEGAARASTLKAGGVERLRAIGEVPPAGDLAVADADHEMPPGRRLDPGDFARGGPVDRGEDAVAGGANVRRDDRAAPMPTLLQPSWKRRIGSWPTRVPPSRKLGSVWTNASSVNRSMKASMSPAEKTANRRRMSSTLSVGFATTCCSIATAGQDRQANRHLAGRSSTAGTRREEARRSGSERAPRARRGQPPLQLPEATQQGRC